MKSMPYLCTKLLLVISLVIFAGVSSQAATESTASGAQDNYSVISWEELIPDDDLDALLNPPEELSAIADGSLEDIIASQISNALEQAGDSRYQQALISTNIKSEFNNRRVKIPGFIVPVAFSEEQNVTSFFLVPYFGACIHVPPPPPNQIIFANYEKGLKLESLYDPFWIEGTLRTDLVAMDIATAAYAMTVDGISEYEE